ncbi:MAG: hypothetical protein ACETVU_01045, partial [Desulfatiglandales bacterium]
NKNVHKPVCFRKMNPSVAKAENAVAPRRPRVKLYAGIERLLSREMTGLQIGLKNWLRKSRLIRTSEVV